MTGRAPAPTAAELRAVAEILVWYQRPGARQALSIYIAGDAPWEMSVRQIKMLLQDVISNRPGGRKLPIAARLTLLEFVAKYGSETRAAPLGTEPMTHRKNVRFGATEMESITAAAALLGVDVTTFIRNAAVLAAQAKDRE